MKNVGELTMTKSKCAAPPSGQRALLQHDVSVFTVARWRVHFNAGQLVPLVRVSASCLFFNRWWRETADWIWCIRTRFTWRPSAKRRDTRNFTPSSASTRAGSVSGLIGLRLKTYSRDKEWLHAKRGHSINYQINVKCTINFAKVLQMFAWISMFC